jgi:hypothetical protein
MIYKTNESFDSLLLKKYDEKLEAQSALSHNYLDQMIHESS